jgi:hypothetical protein
VFERRILRKIFGPTKENNCIWRIKTNVELDELIKHRNILNYVKAQRLSWFGHKNRMPESNCKENIQMETIHRKTSRKAQDLVGRRCQE